MLLHVIYLLALYPFAVAAIFGATFLQGWANDVNVVYLRAWQGSILRVFLAPLYGLKRVEAFTVGYCSVFMVEAPADDLVHHELFHQQQSRREAPAWLPGKLGQLVGAAIYGAKYLWEWGKVGYVNNKFEQQARIAAGQEV